MAHSKKDKRQFPIQIEEEQDNDQRHDHGHTKDYITLKNRVTKSKIQNEEVLLEYYTTEKYNQYFQTLTPIKDRFSSSDNQQMKDMMEMVANGKNVCIFGRGSKIQLLRNVQKKVCKEYHCFHIKAYLPSVSQKKIYNHFGGLLIDLHLIDKIDAIIFRQQAALYRSVLDAHNDIRIVVFLHSIDGPNLMNAQSQQRLVDLFDIPQVQLVCSLDNYKMVMNWSPITLQKYKFCFFNINTHQPYIEEFRYRPLKNQNKQSTEDSLMYVWQSLNKNQKQIAKFIANNQLKNVGVDDSHTTHFTFNDLLQICIQQIVLNSDHQLRQNLLQLLDHRIIIERHDDKKNKKIYLMKYQKRTLQKILDLKIE